MIGLTTDKIVHLNLRLIAFVTQFLRKHALYSVLSLQQVIGEFTLNFSTVFRCAFSAILS